MFTFRKSVALALTSVVAASTILSASAVSTPKALSSNFTLVNLVNGANSGQIKYVKQDGTDWRAAETITGLDSLGDQLIRRQYADDSGLSAGSGSVVVSTQGPVGAVVQIQARPPLLPTFGAYVGVSEGAETANIPLVMRRLTTGSGRGNSQIIIQNASSQQIDIEVQLIGSTLPNGTVHPNLTKAFNDLNANASVEYDLDDEGGLPEGWFGSATVRSTTTGGEVAVVSNLFSGDHGMQTFNAFTTAKTMWGVPLFASKLGNSLSTPIAVQNVSGAQINAGAVTVSCTKDSAAPGPNTLTFTNDTAIANNAAYFFNPVTAPDTVMPQGWFGACTVNSGSANTAVFVQLRTVNGSRAGAHEGIPLDSTDRRVVIPLYAKRLGNGFATAITILNLSTSAAANVSLKYDQGDGAPASCNVAAFTKQIPAGGSLIQNLRLPTGTGNDNPNAVPQVPELCFGALTITSSDQAIHAFAQLDLLDDILNPDPGGDPFQAHNAFTVAATQ